MRIVDALKARNQLTPVHDLTSDGERQTRRERQEAQHAQAVVSMMDEIPRRELDFGALGGRVIEHVVSRDGDYYRPFGGSPPFTGDDVTRYFVAHDGTPTMLERCTNPSSRADLEQMQAPHPLIHPRSVVFLSLADRAGSVSSERYWGTHRVLRKNLAPLVAEGGVRCARCGEFIAPLEPWDLGHVDGSSSHSGPEHRRCNRATKQRRRRGRRVVSLKV